MRFESPTTTIELLIAGSFYAPTRRVSLRLYVVMAKLSVSVCGDVCGTDVCVVVLWLSMLMLMTWLMMLSAGI